MITVVLTSPVSPEVGGVDGSGGDTVEVMPTSKYRHTCEAFCGHFHMHHPRLNLIIKILRTGRHLPRGREGTGVGVGVGGSVMSTL